MNLHEWLIIFMVNVGIYVPYVDSIIGGFTWEVSIPIRIHEHGIFTPTFSYYFTLYLPSCYFFGKLVGKYTCSGPMDPMDLSNFWRYLGFTPPPQKKNKENLQIVPFWGGWYPIFFSIVPVPLFWKIWCGTWKGVSGKWASASKLMWIANCPDFCLLIMWRFRICCMFHLQAYI